MAKKEYRKNCTQVVTPEVDNSSPCEDFNYSECIIVNRKSNFINNIPGGNLNEYLEIQENKILKMQNTITLLLKKLEVLQQCCSGSQGIGTFSENNQNFKNEQL